MTDAALSSFIFYLGISAPSWLNFLDYATGSYIPGVSGSMASTKFASSIAVGINVIMLPGGKVVTIVTTADNQQLTKNTPVPTSSFAGRRLSIGRR